MTKRHSAARALMRSAPLVNAPVTALVTSRFGRALTGTVALVTYTGRRSGRTFTIPVAYRRTGDTVTIGVNLPDAKIWWRNFLGAGGPLTVRIAGRDHPGHAVATRDEAGAVRVVITLTG
ncbi:nitroreductase/quinone reductase family protein [Mycobacterium sp. 1274756.6]|uniref:nitroreductase/quinone reductase family protein n=1 Tax=Mycobacterium sp. 1274756.6 TaxID=1834076 RepID=UPI00080183D5|nr:nitroreductase/quinone reductase family protein [Mycobacterium sp. 1274756.6]OBJ73088.1 hypothetical protein A5643_04655 [Mycobacterium sp. 1274756.6]